MKSSNGRSVIIRQNPGTADLNEVPVLEYEDFCKVLASLLSDGANHCAAYFAYPAGEKLRFICAVAADNEHSVHLFGHAYPNAGGGNIPSMTPQFPQLHLFEREIHENTGLDFAGHPWLKPVRFPHKAIQAGSSMKDYPFYSIESEELHEVGVGPVHAGVIEPGHFRFICNGEKVLHLEIQLGYQHRGVEGLLTASADGLSRSLLAESIAGDTAVGHALCHVNLMEALAGADPLPGLLTERTIALEMERIAVHIGDMAALCGDVAYQFGQVACEALRTVVINALQLWCGNRFGKGLIRPMGTHYPLSGVTARLILGALKEAGDRFFAVTERIFSIPSVLARFEATGKLAQQVASEIGMVGMAARSSGLKRDVRWSHPPANYRENIHEPIVLHKGDVWARAMIRKLEAEDSLGFVIGLLENWSGGSSGGAPDYRLNFAPERIGISMQEGWRGEICHIAVTGSDGNLVHYKVKDPSFHNWTGLALTLRGQEISDFPLCNKSFNLSYCGFDL